ncbi:MAG: toxin-antitoxin system YwqK family antitoxin [Bacteroidetes bacterium CHB5]|nr:toxin-antitoxin system YwqK family antitoxin [Bacteroidetes bacterium CHB5]
MVMRIGRNALHYAKFIGFLAVVTLIWLTAKKATEPPHYSSGKPKITGAFVDGKAEGAWTWWYENGNKMTEGNFVNGKRSGLWNTWYADGSKKSESVYAEDKLNGRYVQWYENGKQKELGNYVNDKREGLYQYFDTAGILLKEKNYKAGIPESNN